MKTSFHKFRPIIALALVLPVTSHAAVTLADSLGFAMVGATGTTRTVTGTELGTFTANGADKLVVTIGGETATNGEVLHEVVSVTYGGVPMLPVISRYGSGNRGSAMYYLDNVSVTGDFVITFANQLNGLGFGAYALSGTVGGFAETASTTQITGTTGYNTDMTINVSEGDFVIAAFARNNNDNGGGLGVVAPLTELFYGGTGGSSAASAYQSVDADGTATPTIYRLSNNVGSVIAATFPAAQVSGGEARITSIEQVGTDLWELMLEGEPSTGYQFYSAPDLVFDPGMLVENLTPGAVPVGSIGGPGDSVLTTDGNGNGTVRMMLTGPRNFVRAQAVPPPPPLFETDFEVNDGGFTVATTQGSAWEWGVPDSDNGLPAPNTLVLTSGNGGSTNAWGTNLGTSDSGFYANPTTTFLRSPVIDLSTASGAELRFAEAVDFSATDTAEVFVINDTDDSVIAGPIHTSSTAAIRTAGWAAAKGGDPIMLPPAALGGNIRLEWRFTGNGESFLGWYIDGVSVTSTSP